MTPSQLASMATSVLVALTPISAAAQSGAIDGGDPAAILNVASGFGMANLETDSQGDPMIVGRVDGVRYALYFYGCKGGADCTSLQFYAGWNAPGVPMDRVNQWNYENRFGRGHIDPDGDPVVRMDVNVDYGVSQRNFEDTFDYWRLVVTNFRDEVVDGG